jgi:hypothetical protein
MRKRRKMTPVALALTLASAPWPLLNPRTFTPRKKKKKHLTSNAR